MLKSYRKLLLIVLFFIVIITSIRLLWLNYLDTYNYPNAPRVNNGILDLRNFSFNQHQTLELNGEWQFYPQALLTEASNNFQSEKMDVPSFWSKLPSLNQSPLRYGSYRMQILLDEDTNHTFGIRVSRIGNASAVYVNGKQLGASGNPSSEAVKHQANNFSYIVTIPSGSDKLDIVIQVSRNAGSGGIYKSLRFGTIEAIQERNFWLTGLQLLLCVFALFNSLYGLILYALGVRKKGLIYFLFVMILLAISTLISDDRLLFQWLDMRYEWQLRITYGTYIGITAFLPPLANNLFPNKIAPKIIKLYAYYCAVGFLFVVIAPSAYILAIAPLLLDSLFIISVLMGARILIRAIKKGKDVVYLLLACISVGNNMIWSIVQNRVPTVENIHYPFDLIIATLAFTAFWFRQYFHATNQSVQLAEKLQQEDRKKDEFLINTSHELRNPLQGISNVLQVILDDGKHPIHPKQKERVQIARDVSKRMNFLLDDLIEITRLNEKTIPLDLKPVYLQSIVFGVLDMIKVMLEGKPIQLRVEMDEHLPAVLADEHRVIQIRYSLGS